MWRTMPMEFRWNLPTWMSFRVQCLRREHWFWNIKLIDYFYGYEIFLMQYLLCLLRLRWCAHVKRIIPMRITLIRRLRCTRLQAHGSWSYGQIPEGVYSYIVLDSKEDKGQNIISGSESRHLRLSSLWFHSWRHSGRQELIFIGSPAKFRV